MKLLLLCLATAAAEQILISAPNDQWIPSGLIEAIDSLQRPAQLQILIYSPDLRNGGLIDRLQIYLHLQMILIKEVKGIPDFKSAMIPDGMTDAVGNLPPPAELKPNKFSHYRSAGWRTQSCLKAP